FAEAPALHSAGPEDGARGVPALPERDHVREAHDALGRGVEGLVGGPGPELPALVEPPASDGLVVEESAERVTDGELLGVEGALSAAAGTRTLGLARAPAARREREKDGNQREREGKRAHAEICFLRCREEGSTARFSKRHAGRGVRGIRPAW